MVRSNRWYGVCAVLAACALMVSAASAVDIETVLVGNIGNGGTDCGSVGYDLRTNCGQVNYAYRIGKYEVTAGQYTEFLNAVAGVDTYGLYSDAMPLVDAPYLGCGIVRSGGGTTEDPYVYSIDTQYENLPVNYVSYGDAIRFANWLHNGQPTGPQNDSTTENGAYYINGGFDYTTLRHLIRNSDWQWGVTTEDEWIKAAYHKNDGPTANYYIYPTGSDDQPGTDQTEATNPGNNANHSGTYQVTPLTNVGEFELTTSPYGAYDMGGNVYELTDGIITTKMYRTAMWGGNVYFAGYYMAINQVRNSIGFDSSSQSYAIGFRVVQALGEPQTCAEAHAAGYGLQADMNSDCYVEWADFGIFAGQWQQCSDPAAPPEDNCQVLW